jgi:hypothetical protein
MSKITNEIERVKNLQNMDFSLPETQQEIFNLLETLCRVNTELQEENQKLKDEINRLKGEKGKPIFSSKKQSKDESKKEKSDKEKMPIEPKKPWVKSSKKDKVKIDRTEIIKLDRNTLPSDVVFKGYEEKIVQNIIIKTDNVLYKLEKYYSPSKKETYIAKTDESVVETEYGPETKALISSLYYENRVTENKIGSFLNSNGLCISEGTISNILINDQSVELTSIKNEIFEAGLRSSIYQQIDDTGMKIGDKNGYATIVCNEKYSVFFINKSKSRETVQSFLTESLVGLFVVLVCDDAPQIKKIACFLALCWVHEERHYCKLNPVLEANKEELKRVRSEIWDYYGKLKAYKQNPTDEEKSNLADEFDALFGQSTCYEDLNIRLALTLKKKSELLVVLDYPEVPLHNNLSENGVREMVLKRKISGGVETEAGRIAWENNMSIVATCKKLGICFYEFMVGLFSKKDVIDLPALILS